LAVISDTSPPTLSGEYIEFRDHDDDDDVVGLCWDVEFDAAATSLTAAAPPYICARGPGDGK